MMTTNTPSAANPALMKKLDYDPVADFSAICRTGNYNFWLVVPESFAFPQRDGVAGGGQDEAGAAHLCLGQSRPASSPAGPWRRRPGSR
ncbi:hypothetical protein [Dankookia sp. P2]|uniref:hypothetical protein n=1 Tax=Dankookia sp. P2 TaxID=3423955 RepID=UPI003D677E2A